MSSRAKSTFYVTGGTLRPDAECYVERDADVGIHESLTRGDFCYVLTSRQMGKSSLMVRTVQRLRRDGLAVAVLDLTAIGQNLTVEQWYVGMLERLGRQLDLEDELEDYWRDHRHLGPVQRWFGALHEVALKTEDTAKGLVVFVDEIDAVRSLPFSTDEFFAAIRECYNRRSAEPEFSRLSFCLLGVATPGDLIRDTRTTPFNIGRRIELQDFTGEEARALLAGLEAVFEPAFAERVLNRVLYWTNGQPYLTQLFCRELVEHPEVHNTRNVDALCSELFLSEQAREKNDNLVFVRERLLRSEVDRFELLQLYDRVLGGARVDDDPSSPLVSVLRLAGAVREEDGLLRVRSPIYRHVFDHQWVVANLPDAELRRQREAYRRGVARAALLASGVLLIFGYLWLNARYQAHRADLSAESESFARRKAERATIRAEEAAVRVTEVLRQMEMQRSEDMFENERAPEGIAYLASLLRNDPMNRTAARRIVSALNRRNFPRPVLDPGAARQMLEQPRVPLGEAVYDWRIFRTNRLEVRIVRRSDYEEVRVIRQDAPVMHANISPEGARVATASMDNTVRIWDIHTGQLTVPPLEHDSPVFRVQFSRDGLRLVTTVFGRKTRVWDAMSGRPLTEPIRGSGDGEFVGGGTAVVTRNSRRGRLNRSAPGIVWDIRPGHTQAIPFRHSTRITSLALDSAGTRLATGARDGGVKIWDVATGLPAGASFDAGGEVIALEFSADGGQLLAAGTEGGLTVRRTDSEGGLMFSTNPGGRIRSAQFSPDGRRVVLADHRGQFQIWSLPEAELQVDHELRRGINWAEFDAAGDRVLTVSDVVSIWNAHTGELISDRIGHFEMITAAHFDPTGRRVVSYSGEQAQLWNLDTGESLEIPLEHSAFIRTAHFNREGTRLVTGANDRTVRYWDVLTGEQLGNQLLHDAGVNFAGILGEGDRLLTTTSMHGSRIWDLETGQPLSEYFRFPHTHEFRFNRELPEFAKVAADGLRAAVKTDAETVRIWDFGDPPVPVPAWLSELAEQVAGERIDERSVVTGADRKQLGRLREQLAAADPEDWYSVWGQWQVADRGRRTIAPGSPVTTAELVDRLLLEGGKASLHEAALLAPKDARVFAALAAARVAGAGGRSGLSADLADLFSLRAAHLAAEPVAAWEARAGVLQKLERWDKAVAAIETALDLAPAEGETRSRLEALAKRYRARQADAAE